MLQLFETVTRYSARMKIKLIVLLFLSIAFSKVDGLRDTKYVSFNFISSKQPPEWALVHYINQEMWKYSDLRENYITKVDDRKIPSDEQFNVGVLMTPYAISSYRKEYDQVIDFILDTRLKYSSIKRVKDNFSSLYNKIKPSAQEFLKKDHNFRVDLIDEKAKRLAKEILTVADCFEFDAYTLTALIQKESYFSQYAVSPTGAAGISQFVMSGLTEAMMQSGEIKNEARDEAILENLESIKCVEKKLDKKITLVKNHLDKDEKEFITAVNKNEKTVKASYKAQIKKYLILNTDVSLIYTGILFKTFLASECLKAPFSKCNTHFGFIDMDFDYVYNKALQRYNGDTSKKSYADDVMNNFRKKFIDYVKLVDGSDSTNSDGSSELQEELENSKSNE